MLGGGFVSFFFKEHLHVFLLDSFFGSKIDSMLHRYSNLVFLDLKNDSLNFDFWSFRGVEFSRKICGVSIIRSGEAMENALRTCCIGVPWLMIKVKQLVIGWCIFYLM